MIIEAKHLLQNLSLNRNLHWTLIVHHLTSGIRRRRPASGILITPLSTPGRVAAIHGHRPTQAKSLSLGECVFVTHITFMFTHSFQLSVLILFHCTIHASLISVFSLLLVCLKNLKKNKKINCSFQLVYFPCLYVVIIKRKPKKISRSSFACWELSRVNSFISFLFFGGREEKTMIKMLSGSYMHYC